MKSAIAISVLSSLMLYPSICSAAPIVELGLKVLTKAVESAATSNATAQSIFSPPVNAVGAFFSGTASTSAEANVSGFSEGRSNATAEWDIDISVNQPGLKAVILTYSFSLTELVRCSGIADLTSRSTISFLNEINNTTITEVLDDSCDTNVGSETFSDALARGRSFSIPAPRFGEVLSLSGSLSSFVAGNTGIFSSAGGTATSRVAYSIVAVVPEPPSTLVFGIFLLAITVAYGVRSNTMRHS